MLQVWYYEVLDQKELASNVADLTVKEEKNEVGNEEHNAVGVYTTDYNASKQCSTHSKHVEIDI